MASEDKIRDYLADNLQLIEDGLTLIQKEQYLPNDQGASGFVDIFCKDKSGKIVIIEIKRSDAAARQAIHELYKYIALVKKTKLLKDSEIRLILISTTWHELKLPYSEFLNSVQFDCEGLEISTDDSGKVTQINKADDIPPPLPRKICRRHYIWEFRSSVDAISKIEALGKFFTDLGIRDLVIVSFDLIEKSFGLETMLYFAMQEESFDYYMDIIQRTKSDEAIKEFLGWIDDLTEESDRVGEAADNSWDGMGAYELLKPDGQQISHPEKAQYWFSDEKIKNVQVHRFGRFNDNNLTDETIIKEIVGKGGNSTYNLKKEINLTSKAEVNELCKSIEDVFYSNEVWKSAALGLIDYAKGKNAATFDISTFNNDDVLQSIAGVALQKLNFLPFFKVEIASETDLETPEVFIGSIEWNGQCPSLSTIVDDYFDGQPDGILFAAHFGEIRTLNSEIMSELGLRYLVCRHNEKDETQKVKVRGSSLVIETKKMGKTFNDFFVECEDFIRDVMMLYANHHSEFGKYLSEILARNEK
ncbi:MAG: endonuclease NucS domain-containing protein [Maricaulaceae bacterium]